MENCGGSRNGVREEKKMALCERGQQTIVTGLLRIGTNEAVQPDRTRKRGRAKPQAKHYHGTGDSSGNHVRLD
jgi:hypothetical protein